MRPAGHRVLPHTADLIIEAWAPTKVECLEEAARALVDSFVDVSDAAAAEPVLVHLERTGDEDLLVSLLEELISIVDVLGKVPVNAALAETEDGGVDGYFDVVPVDGVDVIGPLPKGVSFGDLTFTERDGEWYCHATIDV